MQKIEKKNSSSIILILIAVFLVIFIFLLGNFIIFDDVFKLESAEVGISGVTISEHVDNDIVKNDVEELKEKYSNSDVVGIISIEGLNLNEVVMQKYDNSYYLNHDEYGNYDRYGSVFMDYRINLDTSKKILIFGHNSSYVETPFGELEKYYDKNFYLDHKYILLQTVKDIRKYEIFSVYVEFEDWDYMNLNFISDEQWHQHLVKLSDNSLYDTGVSFDEKDEILILQTCSNNKKYSNYEKKFLLIIAKRL